MSIKTAIKKTARKLEEAVAGEPPQVDLLDTLEEEHQQVAALLERLVESQNSRERKSLLDQVKRSLIPHARAEEKVLYNALIAAKEKGAQQDGEEGYMEHALADKTIKDLHKISNAMSPEFGAASKVLKELIQHHVKEEETTFWSDARKLFSPDERKLLNQKYLAEKKKVRMT
jgi:hypothetical protein